MLVLEFLGRVSGAVNVRHSVTSPGQPVWSYKVTQSLWLPLLGLSVCGKDQALNQGSLLPALNPVADQQKSLGALRSVFACLCLLGSITERASGGTQVVCNRFSVRHQVGARNVL